MRLSAGEPNTIEDECVYDYTKNTGDFQAVSKSENVWLAFTTIFVKGWFIFTLIVFLIVVLCAYLFPDMKRNNETEFKEIGIGVNSFRFARNVLSIDWTEIFSTTNLQYLTMVGTGRHELSGPNLWNVGEKLGYGFLIQTTYAREDLLGVSMIITDIEQDEAAQRCAALGPGYDLPSYNELKLADYYAGLTAEQGRIGDRLKPNLRLDIQPGYPLWTSTPEGSGLLNGDNYRIYEYGSTELRYEDDGYESSQLGFLCVLRPHNPYQED